MPKPEKN